MGSWKKTRLVPISIAAVVLLGTVTDFNMPKAQNDNSESNRSALQGNVAAVLTYNMASDALKAAGDGGDSAGQLEQLAGLLAGKDDLLALMSLGTPDADDLQNSGVPEVNGSEDGLPDEAGNDGIAGTPSERTENDLTGNPADGTENDGLTGNPADGTENGGLTGNPADGTGNDGLTGNPADGAGNGGMIGNPANGMRPVDFSQEAGSDDELYLPDNYMPDEQEEPAPEFYTQGVSHSSVADIQQRLMDLGFMDYSEPTKYYGPITVDAVKLFQRQNELAQDGILGPKTSEMLFADDAKYYLAKTGMEGSDIRRIQQRLYEMGYIAKAEHVTGYFGDVTEAAVKQMQQNNGLAADGKVGHDTMEMLYSGEAKANLLSYGDKSDVVLSCQERLKELGYLTTKPDGQYGNDTVAAVKQFQSRNDLVVDGFLGPSTMTVLHSKSAAPNGLVLGESGDTVKRVQELLARYGYMSSSNCTGYFGEITEAAVKAFQKKNGLSADGNVGMKTMAKLTDSNSAVRAGGGSSGSTGGSGNSGSTGSTGSTGSSGNKGGSSSSVNTGSASVSALLKVAKSKLGKPYVLGAKGPNSFDCSGYVYWCLNQIGIKQSYITSYGWRTVGKYQKITSFSSIKAGDIIVVKGHVGIAAGNGMVYDASSSSGKIVYRSLGSWWKKNFICAWRIF